MRRRPWPIALLPAGLPPAGLLIAALLVAALLPAACANRAPDPSPSPSPPSPAPPPSSPPAPALPDPPPAPAPPAPSPVPAAWIDATDSPFPVRGIVEGFYGPPWSHEQRLAAFTFMARVGMNTYVYAPKDDPYQRAEWRSLYPPAELDRFRALLAAAGRHGIDFVYSISPGLDITYGSPGDRAALLAKVAQMANVGIHTVMLSVDDVPEQLTPADAAAYGGDFARAQVDLANWLWQTRRAQDPAFRLWLTPTHYWGTRPDDYLRTLGAKLDPAVPVVWTGPWVLSADITAADAAAFAAIVGRRAIVWDNYPVNDYTYVLDQRPRLLLGPLRRRSPDLAAHVAGYLLNPMNQATASQLPLYTAAAYLADPGGYDAAAAWQQAARHLAGNEAGAAVLLEFADYARSSFLDPAAAPALAAALAAYGGGAPGAAAALADRFQAMVSLPDRLAGAMPPNFSAEVAPWLQALQDQGEAGLLALQVEAAVRNGEAEAVRTALPALQQALAALREQQATASIAGDLVVDFVAGVIERARP